MLHNAMIPAFFVMLSILLASYVLLDTIFFVSQRYKKRYIEEASVELDDILLQLPANRILDINLALSVFIGIIGAILYVWRVENPSFLSIFMVGAILALVSFPIPKFILRILKKKRLKKFNEQLEEALGSVSSNLKAGFSINQAFEELANQKRHPISVEFRLLMQEIRLGVSMEDALDNMSKRIGSEDFELMATAVITARQTGGELTATLERLANLIRERMRINNKLSAMTSMGRLQAIMIGSMPFLLLIGMFYVSPEMVKAFLNTTMGYIALGIVLVLDIIGFLVIKKITTIDI